MAASRNQRRHNKHTAKAHLPVILAPNAVNRRGSDGCPAVKIVRHVTRAEGDAMQLRGQVAAVQDDDGKVLGYMLQEGMPAAQRVSSVSISRFELLANAGLYGESQTAALDEKSRLERSLKVNGRTLKYLPTEDAVERARAKVAAFGEQRLR